MEPDHKKTDGAVETQTNTKAKRTRGSTLTAPDELRSRSHSRHSAVTDKGQAGASVENLAQIAPPAPGLAEATVLAPERRASPLPSPTSELSSPGFPPPGIIVSDNPQSPHTLIPATDTLTTRPTKGGVAYPFSLKVDGPDGKDVNASTATLESVNITTPAAVEVPQHEKELGAKGGGVVSGIGTVNEQVLAEERPGVERYFTAGPGAGLFSSGVGVQEEKTADGEKGARPPVERFETAMEDLSTLAGAGAGAGAKV